MNMAVHVLSQHSMYTQSVRQGRYDSACIVRGFECYWPLARRFSRALKSYHRLTHTEFDRVDGRKIVLSLHVGPARAALARHRASPSRSLAPRSSP